MLRNQIKVAVRHLRRNRLYSMLNILGLAAAVSCCILIGYYVFDELRYDRFHEGGDRVYRVASEIRQPQGETSRLSAVPWPVGQILETERPEVEQLVHLRSWPSPHIRHDNRVFTERVLFAEPEFFDVFSFELLHGVPSRALAEPNHVVLAERTARKIFGTPDPMGRSLELTVGSDTLQAVVAGVIENPAYSHIDFDVLLPFDAMINHLPGFRDGGGWGNYNVFNYLRLREGADADAFERAISDLFAQKEVNAHGYETTLHLQPLRDIYLRAGTDSWLGPSGNITYVYLLATIGVFILLLAAVNFINLATARAADRAREVGIRKTVGSSRATLVTQFISESVVTSTIAAVAALALATVALPLFNDLAGKNFTHADVLNPVVFGLTLAFGVAIGAAAGFYPSVVLARFRPIDVLKGRFIATPQGSRLRRALVVLQFAISCLLIVGTLVVVRQLDHMRSLDVGFEREGIVVVDAGRTPTRERVQKWDLLTQEASSYSAVREVAVTHGLPGRTGWNGQWVFPEGRRADEGMSVEYLGVDENYVATFGIAVIAGRDFSKEMRSDEENALLINQTAVSALGWASPDEAVGKFIDSPSGYPRGRVVGVIADYHHRSPKEPVGPLVLDVNPQVARYLVVRVNLDQAAAAVGHLEASWQTLLPDYTFDHFFLDESYEQQYLSEVRLQRVFTTFSVLAILIACLGLFGLATYATAKRVKEIGVRKVLGASDSSILLLLSKEFLLLVGVAFVISTPLAYAAASRWLEEFAVRASLGIELFLATGIAAAAIAIVTISYQAIRAARRNPADVLRCE